MANAFTPEQIAQILEEFFKTVGTRQYIGARYVPIFGRKDETSIEWNNSKPYEPLTVVLYQGNSYTSRQYVPAGVQITDESFWAVTGNYNAQIEEYRRETAHALEVANAAQESANDAQNDIDTLLPKSAFSEENTILDAITNDGSSNATNIYVNANYNEQDSDGSINKPFLSLADAFNYAEKNNLRNIYIRITGGSTYDMPEYITNMQVHIYIESIYETTINANTAIYNSYIHFEGTSANHGKMNMTKMHQDCGAIYFRYFDINIEEFYNSWCGISFGSCTLAFNTNNNKNQTYCNFTFSDCIFKYGTNTGYIQLYGGFLQFLNKITFQFDDAVVREAPCFKLVNTITQCGLAAANIVQTGNGSSNSAFAQLEFGLITLTYNAYTKLNEIFTNGSLIGRGLFTKITSNNQIIELPSA